MSKNRNRGNSNNSSKINFKLSVKKQTEIDLTLKSLIGKTIKIHKSTISNQVGTVGKLVLETANFLILSKNGSTINILKQNVTIEIDYKGQALYMDGRFLYSTLTQRIKKFK